MNSNSQQAGFDEPQYKHRVALPGGDLKVYASGQLFATLDYKVMEMANNNLQIPNIEYMSYTPDVHVGVGTCIGTTAVWDAAGGYVSPSIVGSDIGCGMRVHLTNLHKDDLREVKLRRKLVRAIEKYLPMDGAAAGSLRRYPAGECGPQGGCTGCRTNMYPTATLRRNQARFPMWRSASWLLTRKY